MAVITQTWRGMVGDAYPESLADAKTNTKQQSHEDNSASLGIFEKQYKEKSLR